MKKKSISFNGIQLNYSTAGAGPALVLIHGFAEDGSIWNGLVDELEKTHLLIIPQIPGSGGSDPLPGDGVGIPDYAACMLQILKQENISHCIMAGHSMGGYISLAFAGKHPEYLNAIALIHSSAYADNEAKKETRQKAIDFITKNGSEAFLKTAVPDLFADKQKSEADIRQLIEMGKSIAPEVLIQYYKAMMSRASTTHVLEKFNHPVLFVFGEHDKAVPLQQGLEQSHLPPVSHIHILRKSGHMGMLEEKEKTLQIFTHFLQGIYV
jgi:pimeloyl-ACP methyl ester carboxylesterase